MTWLEFYRRKGKHLLIQGEEYYQYMGVLFTVIREPFYSAGKQYGWSGNPIGLGLSQQALDHALRNSLLIRVQVGTTDKMYETSPRQWLDFARQHHALQQRGDTRLFIMQWTTKRFKTIEARPA